MSFCGKRLTIETRNRTNDKSGSSNMDRAFIHRERGFGSSATFIGRLDGEARSAAARRRRRRIVDFEHPAHQIVDEIDP